MDLRGDMTGWARHLLVGNSPPSIHRLTVGQVQKKPEQIFQIDSVHTSLFDLTFMVYT